jgi:hypothetical protein
MPLRLAADPPCVPCMASLDRLAWVEEEAVESFGIRLGVRVDQPALLPALRAALPPSSRPASAVSVDHLYSVCAGGTVEGTGIRRFYVGYSGYTPFVRTLDEQELIDAFESRVQGDVAESASGWTFVHAGAVAWKGRAVVIPGTSFSGKSTLIAALVNAGATYYSDEYAVLDAGGRVHAFPRPMALREPSGTRRVTLRELGEADRPPLPLGAVVATEYRADAVWAPAGLEPAEGVMAMFAHTVRARIAPGPVLSVLARAVEGATILSGPRGDAHGTAARILEQLA